MNNQLTMRQAAKAGNCTASTIKRLFKEGKLQGKQDTVGKRLIRISNTREEVAEIVKEFAPTSGFKKKGKSKISGLSGLQSWVSLDSKKREILIRFAEKFSINELRFLYTVGD